MTFYQHHQVTKKRWIVFNLLGILILGLIVLLVDILVIRKLNHRISTTDHLKNVSNSTDKSETTTKKQQEIHRNFNYSKEYSISYEVSEPIIEKLQVLLTNFNDSNAYNSSEDILTTIYYSTQPPTPPSTPHPTTPPTTPPTPSPTPPPTPPTTTPTTTPTTPPPTTPTTPPTTPPPTEEPIVFTIITDMQKNWFGAFEDCQTRGLYLASILNETELMEVSRQINDLDKILQTASFWLSATDLSESNSYVWMTMGDNVSDQPWLPRPDSSSNHDPLTGIFKHCMGLRYNETADSSTVNEEVCSDYNNYICVNRGGSKSSRNTNSEEVLKQGNKNFSIVTEKEDWYGALAGCERKGLRLVNIESEEDQQAVVDLIRSQDTATDVRTSFWLAGSDLGQVNEYVWMTSGNRFNFTAWLSVSSGWFHYTEPDQELIDGEQEHCVALEGDSYRGYKWIDYLCSAEKFYICVIEN